MNTKDFILVVLAIVFLSLAILYIFVDEMADNRNERACVEKTDMTSHNGYTPNCDL